MLRNTNSTGRVMTVRVIMVRYGLGSGCFDSEGRELCNESAAA